MRSSQRNPATPSARRKSAGMSPVDPGGYYDTDELAAMADESLIPGYGGGPVSPGFFSGEDLKRFAHEKRRVRQRADSEQLRRMMATVDDWDPLPTDTLDFPDVVYDEALGVYIDRPPRPYGDLRRAIPATQRAAGYRRAPPHSSRPRNFAPLQATGYDGPRVPPPRAPMFGPRAPDQSEWAMRNYISGLSDTYAGGTKIPKQAVRRRKTWDSPFAPRGDSPGFSLLDDANYDIDPDSFLVD